MTLADRSTSTARRGQHVTVNGIDLYFEIHGRDDGKPPTVLLHGGAGGIEMFGPNLGALARTRRVIAVDLPGHARSTASDRPMRYESMADDIATLLRNLGVRQADLVGYSLGGGVAQQITFRHPELVRRLVVVSSPFRRTAFYAEILAAFDQMGAATGSMVKQGPLGQLYPSVDFERLFMQIGDLQRQEYDWSREVARVSVPVLLIFADADTYHPEHIVEFYKLLGGGQRDAGWDGKLRSKNQLAIIPNRTHYDLLTTTAVADIVEPFLAAE
ncbi:MAG TPA: alpha/beta hydrolase [Gemmatimonadaceae bacterium]|nr:alpha/beta hydrolase [Gemmatimonadaceae bacterium]